MLPASILPRYGFGFSVISGRLFDIFRLLHLPPSPTFLKLVGIWYPRRLELTMRFLGRVIANSEQNVRWRISYRTDDG